jgi:hypothetical protein
MNSALFRDDWRESTVQKNKKDKKSSKHDDEDSIGTTDTKAELLARAKTL